MSTCAAKTNPGTESTVDHLEAQLMAEKEAERTGLSFTTSPGYY